MFCLVETATEIDTVNETVTEINIDKAADITTTKPLVIETIDTTEKADVNNATSVVVTDNNTIAEESNIDLNENTAISGSNLSNITIITLDF